MSALRYQIDLDGAPAFSWIGPSALSAAAHFVEHALPGAHVRRMDASSDDSARVLIELPQDEQHVLHVHRFCEECPGLHCSGCRARQGGSAAA